MTQMNSQSRKCVSVVIPVYNSEESLPELIERVKSALSPICEVVEIILVDDGSFDSSWKIIHHLTRNTPEHIRGFRLVHNFGQHNALLCGLRQARYETIVTIDDDLQNPPEEIPKLIARLEEGFDVVYGTPDKLQHGFWRNWASRITKMVLQQSIGSEVPGKISAFRAIRSIVVQGFSSYEGSFVNIDVLLTWGSRRFSSVNVRQVPRTKGRSHYTLKKLLTHTLNMVTGFSTLPLQFASLIGFVLTIFGIGILAYVFIRWFIDGSVVQGFPFLASIIAIFSGAQLFCLGIIGEYLARVHFLGMKKPAYVIVEKTQ